MPSESILPSDIVREKQVREIIIEKAEISHNALLKIVVDEKKLMARKTFAKTVKSLLEKGLIFYRQEKNKKIYFEISTKSDERLSALERIIRKQETELPESSKAFAASTLTEKATEVKFIFGLFSANMEINNVMFAIDKMPTEKFVESSSLLRKFLKTHLTKWNEDNDSEYLIAELFKVIMKTNPFFSSMVELLQNHHQSTKKVD